MSLFSLFVHSSPVNLRFNYIDNIFGRSRARMYKLHPIMAKIGMCALNNDPLDFKKITKGSWIRSKSASNLGALSEWGQN